jgi:acyl-ACP thioesterase
MGADPRIWQEDFAIRTSCTDQYGRATLYSLGDCLQEAAGNHTEAMGTTMNNLTGQGLAWIICRLHVKVTRWPRLDDQLKISTWSAAADPIYAYRDFIIRHADGREACRATSSWLILNLETRRPIRTPEFIRDLPLTDQPRVFTQAPSRLRPPQETVHQVEFPVLRQDIDFNGHINNARYLSWLAEPLPEHVWRHGQLRELEITYRNEGLYGDRIVSGCSPLPAANAESAGSADSATTTSFIHSLTRRSDQTTLTLAKTTWNLPEKS